MSVFSIALPNDQPIFSTQVELDAVTYTLSFFWNSEDDSVVDGNGVSTGGAWYISIGQSDGTPIVSGLRVVVNFASGGRFRFKGIGMPPGVLWFEDTSGQGLDPGLTDLGSRVTLSYLDAAEVAADTGF
jgi:hypothetical protein